MKDSSHHQAKLAGMLEHSIDADGRAEDKTEDAKSHQKIICTVMTEYNIQSHFSSEVDDQYDISYKNEIPRRMAYIPLHAATSVTLRIVDSGSVVMMSVS